MVKISQRNLFRSKLRTILTIGAIFIGTFTISLTNGVGNGLKAYVDQELGNIGVEDTFVVQAASPDGGNPFSGDVQEYDPERVSGVFNQPLLTDANLQEIRLLAGVTEVIPMYNVQIEYITAGDKKFQAMAEQYADDMNITMASGTILSNQSPNQVNLPIRYVAPLGFSSNDDAVGKTVTIGYKDVAGNVVEKTATVAGVMQQSLIGSSSIYLSFPMMEEIKNTQSRGIASQTNTYNAVFVKHDPNFTDEQQDALRQLLNANGYTAQTMEDAVGLVNTIIDGILMVLNVFSAIALIAATFGIVNTLFMAVTERTSEIGLFKALGTNRKTIFAIFAMESASIGFWGAILGVGVSMALAPLVNSIARNNFLEDFVGFDLLAFPIGPSLVIVAGIVVLAFLAGTLPSLKASRLDPIKALRYE